jgi:hypothetical protein
LTKQAALFSPFFFALIAAIPASAQQAQEPATQEAPSKSGQNPGQETNPETAPAEEQRWNLFWQATSIGQMHGTFRSPYAGVNSLSNKTELDASITTTLFLGLRLFRNTQLYFAPAPSAETNG